MNEHMASDLALSRRPDRCWRLKCLLGCEGCMVDWLDGMAGSRTELWALCARCGKKRVFLSTLKEQSK